MGNVHWCFLVTSWWCRGIIPSSKVKTVKMASDMQPDSSGVCAAYVPKPMTWTKIVAFTQGCCDIAGKQVSHMCKKIYIYIYTHGFVQSARFTRYARWMNHETAESCPTLKFQGNRRKISETTSVSNFRYAGSFSLVGGRSSACRSRGLPPS